MNGIYRQRDLKRLTQIQKLIERVNGCTQTRQSPFAERTESTALQAEGDSLNEAKVTEIVTDSMEETLQDLLDYNVDIISS
mgnify:CR=1 FL=1